MPNAAGHDAITLALTPVAFIAPLHLADADISTAAVCAGCLLFAGLMFGPDLDLDSRPFKRWGPLRVLWWPYQKALPHRHPVSHGIVISTPIRILYFHLAFGAAALLAIWGYCWFTEGARPDFKGDVSTFTQYTLNFWQSVPWSYRLWGFIGLWAGGASHTLADVIWSAIKPSKRRGRRR